MMALLLHAKANSYFGETRDLLTRLIRIVLQTGLLTSALALLVLPLFFRNLIGIYALPWYILGKSEVISLLANLNARKRSNAPAIHGHDNHQAIPTTKLSAIVFSPVNRHAAEGENSDTNTARSVVQINNQHGSIINADIAGRSESSIEANYNQFNHQTHIG